ncbi:sporulation-specific diadenylate cyclase CdaS [Neobacillus mesonae]|nr:sporulation-specific diadenylate cyclase CdaS [Neobacillus mesonae]
METQEPALPAEMKHQLNDQLHLLIDGIHSVLGTIEENQCCVLNRFEEMNQLFRGIHTIAASYYLRTYLEPYTDHYATLATTVQHLSERRHGALIAIRRKDDIKPLVHSGIPINAILSFSLMEAIFYPGNPLHDGGVVVDKNVIISAGNIYPTAQNYEGEEMLGTRHRAAIGLTERTDCLVLVVSEETGRVSFAIQGKLYPVQPSGLL